jgi:putative ABC transport system permease protein
MTDLRAAIRRLAASPRFTALAVLILAVGIAGNAVVFSLVNGLFLKPLPFPHPERLVDIDATAPKWKIRYTGINYDDFAAWREHNETFIGMATFRSGEFNVSAGRTTARLPGQRVTHDLAEVFGIRPVIGRMFRADEELRGASKVALIGHHIWTEWFNRDASVVGRPLTIDAEVYEIIGVLPPTAVLPSRAAVWIPFEAKPPYYGGFAIGRLKPGVTIDEASADLLRIHRARIPESKNNADTSPIVQPLLRRHLGGAGFIAAVLQGAVAALLLIACANVAGLMLARTLARAPEVGLRAALGASRWQLVRHVTAEGLLLAACGGAAGVLLGQWLLDALLASVVAELPSWIQLEMDFRFAVFVCLAVAVSAIVAGLVPARHLLRRLDVQSLLGPGARQMTAPAARISLMRTLVVGEIALAVLLLLVAGLFGRAMLRLTRIDPGIRAERVLTYRVLLPVAKYRDDASRVAFFEEHLARLRPLPDVEAASASTAVPFTGEHVGNFFEPYGGLPGGPDSQPTVVLTRFSLPGYFDTMGIEVSAGRAFGEQDQPNVIIVNEALAGLFWPGDTAVGKRMRSLGAGSPWLDVIGVARDVRHYGLEDEARPGVYVPFYAMPQPSAAVVVRTRGEPAALAPTVRALLQQQDPTLPLAGLATMEELIGRSLFLRRLYSGMTTVFALIAVVMAMSGLYGVMAYVVGDRTREFGIRLALGAQARDLLRLVSRDGVRLASIGIGIGVIGGVMAGFAVSGLLVGVSPIDPPVLAGTTALLGFVVAVACLVPARRAARLNLLDVLGAE